VKYETIKCVKDIHRDLIIADKWTETHSPWPKAAKLNDVKYLKSHAQVLLDWIGAPNNLWFLARYYLAHVHNLSSNCQLNWKILKQVLRGGVHQTYPISHIPYPDVLLV
jgi:hypothetical protein